MLSLKCRYIYLEKSICTCAQNKSVTIRKGSANNNQHYFINKSHQITLIFFWDGRGKISKVIQRIQVNALPNIQISRVMNYPYIRRPVPHFFLPLPSTLEAWQNATELPAADSPIWRLGWGAMWLVFLSLYFSSPEGRTNIVSSLFPLSPYSSGSPALGLQYTNIYFLDSQ